MIKIANGNISNNSMVMFWPIMVPSQVLGLAFFYGYKRRWMRLVHRILVGIILVLIFLHELRSIVFWVHASEGLHRILVIFETASRWLLFFGNFTVTTIYSARFKEIIDDLLHCNLPLPKDARVKIFRFHAVHLALNIALIVTYDILGHDYVWTNSNHSSVTSTVYIFNDIIILWSGFQFIHMVNVVRELFIMINAALEGYSSIPREISVEFAKKEIVRIRHFHLHLFSISKHINSCFSLQLLCIILFSVIQTTYALRAFISEIIRPDIGSRMTEAILDILWGMTYMFFVYQIIAVADYTAFESKKSSAVVHHLINNHFQNRVLEQELEIFSLQIHQNQVIFSIWLFDINFTLLNTLISLLTTYIIILLTFQEEWKEGGLSGWNFNVDE